LSKLIRRAGPGVIAQLNAALLAKLAADKLLRARKLRIDTTVVEADIDYPTDADLLEQAVRTLGGLVRRLKARGAAPRTAFGDRSRSAGRRLRQLTHSLRRRSGVAMGEVDRLTAQVATIARQSLRQTITLTGRLLWQTQQRLAGNRSIPDRVVSLADPDARPIRKGKPRSPTQFGYTLLLAEDERGFVADHLLSKGNPPTPHNYCRPCVAWPRCGAGRRAPWSPTAASVRRRRPPLAELGVRRIGLQRTGTPSRSRRELEQTRAFKRMRNWRVGIEARISHLKRSFGLRHTRLRRLPGARIWVGLGCSPTTCSG
jgi:IS5 family transposase